MGRLFDAVSALTGVRQVVAYEAQAAVELEGISRGVGCGTAGYAFAIDMGCLPAVIDAAPVLAAIVEDLRTGVPAGIIGMRFHRAVSELTADFAGITAITPKVALSGGVWQNALLLELARERLRARGFEVLTHRRVPPNDGGIALGQILVGNSG
jgi:hydrogenase maturation protein HypF